tara:strand:- start:1150 stop:1866 length:717 start_codon:yes stop_codon:yes gene_type:complete
MGRRKGGITTCGWCGGVNHNKRTCPDLKKYVAQNPDGWRAQEYNRKKVKAASNRKCSYCAQSGHNRKTCEAFKTDNDKYCGLNYYYQKKILKSMNDLGFGVGSLVKYERYSGKVEIYLVTKINWDQVNIANWFRSSMGEMMDKPIQCQRVDIGGMDEWDRKHSVNKKYNLPEFVTEKAEIAKSNYAEGRLQMLSGVEAGIPSLLDTESGAAFLRHKDYASGYGCRTIVDIEYKWTGEE